LDTILTIAIPTFNRYKILKENLELIFEDLDDDIQVYVSDNHSTDKTNIVCEEFTRYKNFKYLINEKNIGYDANVLTALTNSNSKYVWFLSDDDFVNKDLIKYVYSYLKINQPDGILLNAVVKSKNSDIVLIESLGSTDETIVEFCDDSTFIKYIQWSTLISSIIIKKDNVSKDKAIEYIGSCFIQLSIFWNSCFNKNIHILGSKKITKFDSEKPNFNLNNYEIWFKSWIKVVSSFSNIFSKETTKIAATSLYTNSRFNKSGILIYVILSKSFKIISLKDYNFIISNLNLNFSQRFFILIILLVPANIIIFSIWSLRVLKRLLKK
jgi:glycosyltransferase involved in cell wall biosynthesis